MKNLLALLTVFLFSNNIVQGQPKISADDPFFFGGLTQEEAAEFAIAVIESDFFDALFAEDGPDRVWDYQDLDVTFILAESIKFVVPCSEAEGAENFENCGNAVSEIVAGTFQQNTFRQFDGTNVMELGTAELGGGPTEISLCITPRVSYSDPITFDLSISSTFACEPADINGDFVSAESGERNVSVDAYGVIALLAGSFENVLRIKTVETGESTTYNNGTVLLSQKFERTTFEYVMASFPVPLFTATKSQFGENAPTYQVEYITGGIPTGVNDLSVEDSDWVAYPNPFSNGEVTLRSSDFFDSNLSVSLYGLDGRLINSEYFASTSGLKEVNLDFSLLTPGTYLLKANTERVSKTIKVQVKPE